MRLPLTLAAVLMASAAHAQQAPSADQPVLRTIAADVDAKALESTIRSLVGFGTRHTLSDTKSDKRGIGAAGRLMGKVAETARAEGMRITPLCSYAAAWLKRNDPDLIA